MLGDLKILESIKSKNPSEATDYIGYLTSLAIKGTAFQTRAILAFDQDYRATELRDNISWGSSVDDLSAQSRVTPDAIFPPPPPRANDGRISTNEEFCFRWIFSPNGCPNTQSCRSRTFVFTVHNPTKAKLAPASLVLAKNHINDSLHAQLMNMILFRLGKRTFA